MGTEKMRQGRDLLAPKRRKPGQPEHRLQAAIAQHLKLRCEPGVWWSSVDHATRDMRLIQSRAARGIKPGFPDMVFCVAGHFKGLELKADRGRVSAAQELTGLHIRTAGGDYAVAYGIDEALSILEGWGVLTPNAAVRRAA